MMYRLSIRSLHASASTLYKVAIVGTGPAGFYTAHHLLHKSKNLPISIDFFDRLPTPFGLSRYGVAPDHPEVKNCEEYMENIMNNDKFDARFFGNVNVGKDISLLDLKNHYHSIVLAYGCTASDNKLDLEGSDHPAVLPARKLVNWYNGHPDAAEFDFTLENVEDVTIIGNGNVAIDVARILIADPEKHWQPTDITSRAVEVLKKSDVKRINVVARRGLLESAFTNKEIRELVNISKNFGVRFVPIPPSILEPIKEKSKSLGRVDKRKFSILEKASQDKELNNASDRKEWELKFALSPKKFIPDSENPTHLHSTVFEQNELVEDTLTKKVSVKPTGNLISLKNQLVILSIGYKGNELEGFKELDISFDKRRNCISNNEGRILSKSSDKNLAYCHGWYTSGWIKHGPKGVIATTMMESFDTAEKIIEDLSNGICNQPRSNEDIADVLLQSAISWKQWLHINGCELEAGIKEGKTREKIPSVAGLLKKANEWSNM